MKIGNYIWGRMLQLKDILSEAVDELISFGDEEDGVGVVEVILILVVLIGLVIIFKEQITDLVNSIFDTVRTQAGKV